MTPAVGLPQGRRGWRQTDTFRFTYRAAATVDSLSGPAWRPCTSLTDIFAPPGWTCRSIVQTASTLNPLAPSISTQRQAERGKERNRNERKKKRQDGRTIRGCVSLYQGFKALDTGLALGQRFFPSGLSRYCSKKTPTGQKSLFTLTAIESL